jgi:hypothetical protein
LAHYQNSEIAGQAEALPLRQDMVTLLTFVRDNKVVGVQGTGNMPMKAVREVTPRFVKPPLLEYTIGKETFHIRSETELWPLYFLRVIAEVGRLLKPGSARLWRLTRNGDEFLDTSPLLQLSYLLTIWWHKVDWLIAYPYTGMGDALPQFFNRYTLDELLALPAETYISFEKFADALIEKTGLTWGAPDNSIAMSIATTALRGSVSRMIIHILADFGATACKYRKDPLGKGTISRLDAFKITPLGKALLEAVAIGTL